MTGPSAAGPPEAAGADSLTVAAVQFEVRELDSADTFAAQVTECLDAAAGARLVVFPELMTTGLGTLAPGWRGEDVAKTFARVADHSEVYLTTFAAAARERDQVIVGGSHLVPAADGFRNVAHTFFPDGRVARHEKTLLFPAETTWHTGEGDRYEVFDVDGVSVAVAICYEAEVPEIPTILARMGAEVLVVPSFTFTEAGFHRVRHCVAARCIENQLYAVHCSTYATGLDPLSPGWARSSVLSPCGDGFPADGVLAQAPANSQEIIAATLDLALLREARRSGVAPTVADRQRRADLFAAHGTRF